MANEFVMKNGYISKGNSQLSGSLNVSGSISASLGASTVGFHGTASWAVSASWAPGSSPTTPGGSDTQIQFNSSSVFSGSNNLTFNYNNNNLNITGSVNILGPTTGSSFTGSFVGDGSGLTGVVASASPGGPNQSIQFNDSGATSGSSNFTFDKGNNIVYLTGSFISNNITSSLYGTASWAQSSSQAVSASYTLNAVSSSFSTTSSFSISSSRAISSSFALNTLSASYTETASYALNAISSSFSQTASYVLNAVSASYASTASYVLNAVSSSFATTASYINPLNQNVIITGSILMTGSAAISKVNYIDFTTLTTAQAPPHLDGRIHWSDDTKTLEIDTDVQDFMIEVGHQNVVRVVNKAGLDLVSGSVVYISGSLGQRPAITTASWEGDSTSAATIGFVAKTINDNNNGYVVTNGILRGVNTNGFSAGTQLYLSSSGQFTDVAPDAPLHEVRLGKVIVGDPVDGIIYVDVMNGYELTELHDVKTTTYDSGDLLIQSGALWINSKQLIGSYGLSGSLTFNNGGITGSLLGTASWANSASQALTASFLPVGTYQITASWAESASNSINAQTASFLNPGTYQITASWAQSSSQALTASFLPVGTYNITSSWAQSSSQATSASYVNLLAGPNITINYQPNGIAITGSGGSGTPGGPDKSLQFNDSSTFSGSSNLTFDKNINILELTGSLAFSGSLIGQINNLPTIIIDGTVSEIYDTSGNISSDFRTRKLNTAGGITTVDWGNLVLYDQNNTASISWDDRRLLAYDSNNDVFKRTVNWGESELSLNDIFENNSIRWGGRELVDNLGLPSLDWKARHLVDNSGAADSIKWGDRLLLAPDGSTIVLDWNNTTGSFIGTSSFAISSSIAISSSFASTSSFITASNVFGPHGSNSILSSSFAVSASWAPGGGGAVSTYTNGVDNRVITSTGVDGINGEANLTFDGSTLAVTGNVTANSFTGSLFGTSSWSNQAITASFLNPGTYQITASWAQSSSQALTASFVTASNVFGPFGSNSILTSSFATTASFVNGMITKNNAVAGGTFSGNPKKATVTFSTAFPNTNYSITITGEDLRSWTIESKLAGSFIINANSNTALSNNVYWQAISYGEFNS